MRWVSLKLILHLAHTCARVWLIGGGGGLHKFWNGKVKGGDTFLGRLKNGIYYIRKFKEGFRF